MMTSVLAPEVYVDYASSGRELPAVMPAAEFVARRQRAVDTLMKHHSFSNLLLEATVSNVRARCNNTILRFAVEIPAKGEDFYHSCGTYEFVFSKTSGGWTIASVTQKHLKSWGNRSLMADERDQNLSLALLQPLRRHWRLAICCLDLSLGFGIPISLAEAPEREKHERS